jgi:hypothetical protein
MTPRVVLLVLDGFSPHHCRRAVTPALVAAGEAGARPERGDRRSRKGPAPARRRGRGAAVAPGILYEHAAPGRGFSSTGCLLPGIHGCPETAATLCIATGGHPAIAGLRRRLRRAAPTSADWPRLLARATGLAWPPAAPSSR